MHIEGLTKEDILRLNIPTGAPLVYDYINGELVRRGYLTERGHDRGLEL